MSNQKRKAYSDIQQRYREHESEYQDHELLWRYALEYISRHRFETWNDMQNMLKACDEFYDKMFPEDYPWTSGMWESYNEDMLTTFLNNIFDYCEEHELDLLPPAIGKFYDMNSSMMDDAIDCWRQEGQFEFIEFLTDDNNIHEIGSSRLTQAMILTDNIVLSRHAVSYVYSTCDSDIDAIYYPGISDEEYETLIATCDAKGSADASKINVCDDKNDANRERRSALQQHLNKLSYESDMLKEALFRDAPWLPSFESSGLGMNWLETFAAVLECLTSDYAMMTVYRSIGNETIAEVFVFIDNQAIALPADVLLSVYDKLDELTQKMTQQDMPPVIVIGESDANDISGEKYFFHPIYSIYADLYRAVPMLEMLMQPNDSNRCVISSGTMIIPEENIGHQQSIVGLFSPEYIEEIDAPLINIFNEIFDQVDIGSTICGIRAVNVVLFGRAVYSLALNKSLDNITRLATSFSYDFEKINREPLDETLSIYGEEDNWLNTIINVSNLNDKLDGCYEIYELLRTKTKKEIDRVYQKLESYCDYNIFMVADCEDTFADLDALLQGEKQTEDLANRISAMTMSIPAAKSSFEEQWNKQIKGFITHCAMQSQCGHLIVYIPDTPSKAVCVSAIAWNNGRYEDLGSENAVEMINIFNDELGFLDTANGPVSLKYIEMEDF